MPRPIGYYVHHHGDGHRQRALAIAAHAAGRITLLGTGLRGRTDGLPLVDLPDDRMAENGFGGLDGTCRRPPALHYAPLDHAGVRQRTALIAQWIAEERPALMVIDVSVEVAMLTRLASVPIVYVRLNGRREDRPHQDAFASAAALLAPFHADLDDEGLDPAIAARTYHAPGLSPSIRPRPVELDLVLGVIGRGSGQASGDLWAEAARATPDLRWQVVGPCSPPASAPPNLSFPGWVDDATDRIARAGIVVGAAGDGLVGAVLAARRPFLCLPEPRPYDEQQVKARRLAATGAALCRETWPGAGEWPALIAQARALDPAAQARLDDPDGARHAARWLLTLADARATMAPA